MPPPPRKGVAPADAGGDDLEWASAPPPGCCASATASCCSTPAFCQSDALRQHWRLSFVVLGGAFVGLVVYLALNAYNVTQQQSQNR
jgi:hypothetical protein